MRFRDFFKYSAHGNDFVIFDNRLIGETNFDKQWIKAVCDRKFGIGADGVLFLSKSNDLDFHMTYFNADGNEAEMCANGARAISHFAHNGLSLSQEGKLIFSTQNGVYESVVENNFVKLKMTELNSSQFNLLDNVGNFLNKGFVNTGVPHAIFQVEDVNAVDVVNLGKQWREDKIFSPKGANINFFQLLDSELQIIGLRTYERGVENETLSCGTGVTACAIASSKFFGWKGEIKVITPGGELAVYLNEELSEIYFSGEVINVFSGRIS